MENGYIESFDIGTTMRIYFHDGEKISMKEGKVTGENQNYLILDNKDVIPYSRIVRGEVL